MLAKIYCRIFGSEDIKQPYQDIVIKALKDFKVNNCDKVPIKKMNKVGSIIALMPLSSFTAFGIWFDENFLDESSKEERIFQIYHEAAHYVKKHHTDLLIKLAAMSGLSVSLLRLLYTQF